MVSHSFFGSETRCNLYSRRLHVGHGWRLDYFTDTFNLYSPIYGLFYSWNKFEALWSSDRLILCEQFVNRGFALVHIDEKLCHYTNIAKAMDAIGQYRDIGPIRINLQHLIQTIRTFAIDWKDTLSKFLIDKTKECLRTLHQHMTVIQTKKERGNCHAHTHFIVMRANSWALIA